MLIFNTTYLIGDKKTDLWVKWAKETHIPFMLKTGKFSDPQLAKILCFDNSEENTSFSIQFKIKNMDDLGVWNELYSEKVQREITEKFGTEVLPFSTVLEVVE